MGTLRAKPVTRAQSFKPSSTPKGEIKEHFPAVHRAFGGGKHPLGTSAGRRVTGSVRWLLPSNHKRELARGIPEVMLPASDRAGTWLSVMAEQRLVRGKSNWVPLFPESQRGAITEGVGDESLLYRYPERPVSGGGLFSVAWTRGSYRLWVQI